MALVDYFHLLDIQFDGHEKERDREIEKKQANVVKGVRTKYSHHDDESNRVVVYVSEGCSSRSTRPTSSSSS